MTAKPTASDHLLTRQHNALVSHQLKLFLTNSQKLLAELPQDDLPPSSRQDLRRLENQMSLWQDLIMRFNQSPTLQLDLTVFNVNDSIKEAIADASAQAKSKKIQLIFEDTGQVKVLADELLIRFILDNLIDNAIKFTANEGRISFAISPSESKVLVSIRDSGVGIGPTELSQLRQRLQSNDGTQANISGLQVAQIILGWHNETLGIESTPGSGSVFHFTLRKADD